MKQGLCLVFLIFSSILYADEYRSDIRELCRAEVAGTLIRKKNKVDMLEQSISLWEQKLIQLEREEAKLEKRRKPLLIKAENEHFDLQLEEQITGVNNRLDVVVSQIRLGRSDVARNMPALEAAKKALKHFRSEIKPVFKIAKVKIKQEGAYNFSVAYRYQCGAYQYICPLPKSHREGLVKVAELLSVKTHCERYAQVLPPLPQ